MKKITKGLQESLVKLAQPILDRFVGDLANIVAQNEELLLQGGFNTNVLAERVVFNLSCRAGRDLANAAISEGCISFLGYDEDFIFVITSGNHADGGMIDSLSDEAVRGFFESHNIAPISYIQGASLADSYYSSQDVFNYWIEVWNAIDSQVAGLLVWDRDHQIMKPTIPSRLEAAPKLFPLVVAFAPLLLIPITKGLKKLNTL